MASALKRWIKVGATVVAVPILLYLVAATAGSLIPVNGTWRESANASITIYVTTNGVHTGLILPTVTAGHDWSTIARSADLPDAKDAGQWLLFGWGDRQFYLETPTWSDLRLSTAVGAFAGGSGGTLVHVDHLDRPQDAGDVRPIRLTAEEYLRLVGFIRGTFAAVTTGSHPKAIPGYSSRDVFYEARGRYSVFRTCNVWTGEALAATGIKVASWPPFSHGVMRWYEESGSP